MILEELHFDDHPEGATVSAPSPWLLQGASWTARTESAAHGERGARAEGVTGQARLACVTGQSAQARVLSYYWRLIDTPGLSYLGNLTDGGTLRGDWRINTNGTVTIRNGYVAAATSTEAVALNVWHRSEWKVGPDGQELRIYVGEATAPLLTLAGPLTNNQHTALGYGITNSGTGSTLDIDTILVADDWTGPFAAETDAPLWHLVTGAGVNVPLASPVVVT